MIDAPVMDRMENEANPDSRIETPEAETRRVVSVSIGSSSRNATMNIQLLGQDIQLERIGTDGNMKRAAELIRQLDGQVDAIGLGGIDLFLMAAGRRYYLRDGVALARNAKITPVVCGAALKDTLERVVVTELDRTIHWQGKKVLLVAGVDRFGMAETLDSFGADVTYGDVLFSLGLPLPLRKLSQLNVVARILLPVVSQLPIGWIYPTGDNQTRNSSSGRSRYFSEADIIAGDFHYIRRYAPARLDNKIILTNTTTAQDVEDLQNRGAKTLITTTPRIEGRSLATNLLDAALVASSGKFPLEPDEYRDLITRAGLQPDIQQLNP
jgi:hypothetical protein